MSERTLKQLVGALAIAIGVWAVVSVVNRGGGGIEASGAITTMLAGVDGGSVTGARWSSPTDTVELSLEVGAWKVNGWEADSGSVARFLDAVTTMEIGDLVATNPSNHERMGVSEDSASALTLSVGQETRTFLVGHDGPRFGTAYVRLPGDPAVYLMEGTLRSHLHRDLSAWRNRRVVAIDTSRVSRIEIERDDDAYALVRGDSLWTFDDGSEARASAVASLLGELGGSLVASGFPDDSLASLPRGGSAVAYDASGAVLARIAVGSGSGDRWTTAAGDSVRYQIAPFRVNLIVPTMDAVRPAG